MATRNGTVSHAKREANRLKRQASASARRVRKTAMHEASGLWDEVLSAGSRATEAARDGAHQMRRQAEQFYEEGRDRVLDVEQSLEDKIRENPLKALLIAAGVGLAGGLLFFRRS